jgi:hypothetical protein
LGGPIDNNRLHPVHVANIFDFNLDDAVFFDANIPLVGKAIWDVLAWSPGVAIAASRARGR